MNLSTGPQPPFPFRRVSDLSSLLPSSDGSDNSHLPSKNGSALHHYSLENGYFSSLQSKLLTQHLSLLQSADCSDSFKHNYLHITETEIQALIKSSREKTLPVWTNIITCFYSISFSLYLITTSFSFSITIIPLLCSYDTETYSYLLLFSSSSIHTRHFIFMIVAHLRCWESIH